jgi:uncharacterized RmlC-like cupin family protein
MMPYMTIEDAAPTVHLLHGGAERMGKQGHLHAPGVSAESAGAQRIHLEIVRIAPGQRARAHKHKGHETAIYILSGKSGMWYGRTLEHHLVARAGDFLYVPANMPHLPYNLSDAESCVAVIARTDPNDQESVVLLPELESCVAVVARIDASDRESVILLPRLDNERRA